MSYTTTALGLQLPVPGSGQAWQTSVYNANLQKLEDAIAAQTGTGKPFGLISRGTVQALPNSGTIFAPDQQFTWDPASRILRGDMALDAKGQAFTVPMDGEYELDGALRWDTNGSGTRSLWWVKNPTDPNVTSAGDIDGKTVAMSYVSAVNGDATTSRVTKTVPLLKGDKVVLWARQTSGGQLPVTPATTQAVRSASFASVRYVGPSV